MCGTAQEPRPTIYVQYDGPTNSRAPDRMIDLALILAAGSGSRMQEGNSTQHKALVPLRGVPILVRICQILARAGMREAIVVIGYEGDQIRSTLAGRDDLGIDLSLVENQEWRLANGLSVVAAGDLLTRDYLLMMADHIFDPVIIDDLCGLTLSADEVVLAVDRKVGSIYDLDDATKVLLEGNRIVAIDKQLDDFNAVDTGLFVCSPVLVTTLAELARKGDCSLSDGMRRLAGAGNLRYLDIGESWWQDVDTPGALEQAERLLAAHPPDAT